MSKNIYPAIFTNEDGIFTVHFPDFESCYTQGESLEEACEMAEDVLALILYNMEENHIRFPIASDIKSIQTAENQFASLICCDTASYRRFYDNKIVKKTLTLPAWLNSMSEAAGLNFSEILREGLKQELHIAE